LPFHSEKIVIGLQVFILNISPQIFESIVVPILIVLARVLDVSIGTLRIIFVSKGLKYLAPVLGFFEVLVWLIAIGQIMKNLTNPVNYIAYAFGFALGNFIGILIENKIAMGVSLIRVITAREASELIENLRNRGLTVTSIDAEGNRGSVKVFFTIVKRKELKKVISEINSYNPNAFFTIEDISFVNQKLLPMGRDKLSLFKFLTLKRR